MVILVAALVAWKLPTPNSSLPADGSAKPRAMKISRIDICGSLLIFCTIAALLLVLDLGGKKLPFHSPILIGLICATLGFAMFFVLVEGYWAREPVFPLRLAVDRDVATAYGIAALQLAAEFGVSLRSTFQPVEYLYSVSNAYNLIPGHLNSPPIFPNYTESKDSCCWCSSTSWPCCLCSWRPHCWSVDCKVCLPPTGKFSILF